MRIILLFIYLFISTNVWSQSCGDWVWTQSDIDNFPSDYPGCTEILGLQVASDVTNMDSFYNVTKITEGVFLSDNLNIVDISGLSNVDSIMGSVTINTITLSSNFTGVEYIEGNLSVYNASNEGSQIDFQPTQCIRL